MSTQFIPVRLMQRGDPIARLLQGSMREIFQSNAIGQSASIEACLSTYLAQGETLLRTLTDSDYPNAGHDFVERLHAAHSHEEARTDMYMDVPAAYAPFDPNEKFSFINLIKYNMIYDGSDLPAAAEILRSRLHEGDHAIAWSVAAILHATPFNNAAPVIMDPESFLIACDLVERNSYTKQAWLGSLIGRQYPDFHFLTARDPLSSQEFISIRDQYDGALLPALTGAAHIVLAKSHHLKPTYADHYHACALRAYEKQMDYLLATHRTFEFVRIGMPDVEDIGGTYGPNIFRDQPIFSRVPHLSNENREALRRLCAKYDTGAHVPEFGTVVNKTAFLETSKNQGLYQIKVSAPQLVAA